jgi:16S rRNA (guanine(966)-N(2))-methyltransferase RsmD
MTLKILAGKFGGRLIKTVKTQKTRPTTSLIRKAVFDILQPFICDSVFLDLCAGSGAIGIEALSRGAREVIFVDSEREAVQCIHTNLKLLDIEKQAKVMQSDARAALEKLKKVGMQFDIIYVDPPYESRELYLDLIHSFDRGGLLKEGGALFVETKAPSPLAGVELSSLKAKNPRRYGDSLLCEYVRI